MVALALVAAAAALVLAACGGGVGTGGTGSFAAGPITGFGSVIVNEVAFDDAGASVEDGDGGRRTRAELRLGMTVEIDSDAIAGASARARSIRYDSALVGPVDTVSPATASFTMLGQTVTVDDTTVFDERLVGRLALLLPGGWAEVYALYDPAQQRYRATRIEARLVQPPAYRIRGIVSQLSVAPTRTFRIGNAVFNYEGASGLPADLANGKFVRLRLDPTTLAGGVWRVATFGTALRTVDEQDDALVKGLVTAFTSATNFQLDGRAVDASTAQFDGTPALGQRVEVQGTVRGGVLRARSVKLRSDDFERDRGFELRGAIESVDAAARSFVLRGVTVSTARSDLRYDNGGAADLVVGRRVEVRGPIAADGTRLDATRIRFE